MNMKSIVDEIVAERWRQDGKYGGAKHDDQHEASEWQEFIAERAERLTMTNDADYRKYLIQIAALAVAAIQSLDRIKTPKETL